MAVIDKARARVSHTVVVSASPPEVFHMLADPREHVDLDGSGLIRGVLDGPGPGPGPGPGGTEVTETFDYQDKRVRRMVELIGIPRRAAAALDKSLACLQARYPQPAPAGRNN